MSFLPIYLSIPFYYLVGIVALFSIIRYRNNKKYVISLSSSGIGCILAATEELLIEKYYISRNILNAFDVTIVILVVITAISLGIDFVEKTKNKPELRRLGKICLVLFLMVIIPMIILAIIL